MWTAHTEWYTVCMRLRAHRGVSQRKDGAARRRRWKCPHAWYEDALARYREGVPALWFGVLDNAIQALRGKLRIAGKAPSRAFLRREAERWVRDDRQEPLGTFASICRELNLDRATVRADLLGIEFVGQTPRTASYLRLIARTERAA